MHIIFISNNSITPSKARISTLTLLSYIIDFQNRLLQPYITFLDYESRCTIILFTVIVQWLNLASGFDLLLQLTQAHMGKFFHL